MVTCGRGNSSQQRMKNVNQTTPFLFKMVNTGLQFHNTRSTLGIYCHWNIANTRTPQLQPVKQGLCLEWLLCHFRRWNHLCSLSQTICKLEILTQAVHCFLHWPDPQLLWVHLLCVSEDMLLEVLPPHEELLTVIALEVLLPGVDDHVRLQVSLLCEWFVTEGAAVILLT